MNSLGQIATIVINVSGGVVRDVVATNPVRVIVVDYDIDDEAAHGLPTIVARDGSKDKAFVAVPLIACDSMYVRGVENAIKL